MDDRRRPGRSGLASLGGFEQLAGVAAGGGVAAFGAEHPHDLGDELVAVAPVRPSRRGLGADRRFSIRKWVSASEATCGRCVMQITCRSPRQRRAAARRRRARCCPPIPASISSKTSVALAARARRARSAPA